MMDTQQDDTAILNGFPDVLLEHVFCMVGDALDLLWCERTCRAFHRVLKNDKIWGTCEESKEEYNSFGEHWPKSHRERAFVVRAANQCHKWQRYTEPVILSVVSIKSWERLVTSLIIQGLQTHDIAWCCNRFPLRGDTSAVLMTLVEEQVVQQMRRVVRLRRNCNPFALSEEEFALILDFGPTVCRTDVPEDIHRNIFDWSAYNFENIEYNNIVSREEQRRIIHRLSCQAGIIQFETGFIDRAWLYLLETTFNLLQPACISLASRPIFSPEIKQMIGPNEHIRNVSPLPEKRKDVACLICRRQEIIHWIVPKQIEEAARSFCFKWKVYGDEWHAMNSADGCFTTEQRSKQVDSERHFAESKYHFIENSYSDHECEEDIVGDHKLDDSPETFSDDGDHEYEEDIVSVHELDDSRETFLNDEDDEPYSYVSMEDDDLSEFVDEVDEDFSPEYARSCQSTTVPRV